MNHEFTLPLVALFSLSLCASTSRAQEEGDSRVEQARELFETGVEHHADERFLLAAQAFERAHELMVNANHPNSALILFNLAASLEEIPGRESDAREAYDQFLREADPEHPRVQENLSRAQARIRELDARMAAAARDRPGEPQQAGSSNAVVGGVVMAGGGASLIVGAVLGGVAIGVDGDLATMCDAEYRCPASAVATADEVQTLAIATDVLLFGGLAVASVGVVLFFTLRQDEDSANTAVLPSCDGSSCGIYARGEF